MSQSDDLAAINAYMNRTPAKTQNAANIKNAWNSWYPNLGVWDRNMSSSVYDEARQRRTAFNAANLNPEVVGGMTTEDMQKTPDPDIPIVDITNKVPKAVVTPQGSHPFLKRGMQGPAVTTWQRILGLPGDGNFGKGTEDATKIFQSSHGLKVDGKVGPNTWAAGLGAPVEVHEITPAGPVAIKPQPVAVSKPAAKGSTPVKPAVVVTEAGFFSGLSGLPLWAKITGGATLVLAVVFGGQATMETYYHPPRRRRR